ncbi:UTRA domain-containing protein [Microvirga brassicacearum]|uniref:UTRA domain-containing protein n=1 Tax=Microvirga brassicacearum TaxID=2580413 RepID=A0A5N3PBT2_9HYPH|nr:UTRA domain-containing protein [Microvirga brassicacearum]KAB0267226.1 UTRA domain-containing protein [Microvirga brassicacearum]
MHGRICARRQTAGSKCAQFVTHEIRDSTVHREPRRSTHARKSPQDKTPPARKQKARSIVATAEATKTAQEKAKTAQEKANLKLDGQGPLWRQIRTAIERMIASGVWPPGHPIPSEFELMARYGAARMTVHRALRSLAADNIVLRRRRAGTIVAERAPERPVFEMWDIAAEVKRAGDEYSFVVVEHESVAKDDERRKLLEVEPSVGLEWVVCVHLSNGIPLQLEERLFAPSAIPKALNRDFGAVPPKEYLRDTPWTEAEHVIYAKSAPRYVATHLKVRAGAASLVVERRTWNDSGPVTFARLWHCGERYRIAGRFKPNAT